MLRELRVQNFAIIGDCQLQLSPGLNVLTGETGAGKSIIVGAIAALAGSKVKKEDLRSAEAETVIEGAFVLRAGGPTGKLLAAKGYAVEDELVLRRVIASGGKSRVYLNGQLATLSLLSELGKNLVDISGQHEQQILLQENSHLEFLDRTLGLENERAAYAQLFQQVLQQQTQLEKLESQKKRLEEQKTFLAFQAQELTTLALKPGEEGELLAEREKLQAAEKIRGLAEEAKSEVSETEQSLLARSKKLVAALESLAAYDPSLAQELERAHDFFYCCEDILHKLRDLQQSVAAGEGRLEQVEDRLHAIRSVQRKYGSVENALQEQEKIARQMGSLDNIDGEIEQLRAGLEQHETSLFELAEKLSARRLKGKRKLEQSVKAGLTQLGMQDCEFQVVVEALEEEARADGLAIRSRMHRANGRDQVSFYITPNPGEPLKKLAKIASGGELSRILLALKEIAGAAEADSISIFDEVDSGIGGGVAEQLGIKLVSLARKRQVFCITHLPQIAARAAHHLCVNKAVRKGATLVEIKPLTGEMRKREIARMLAGKVVGQAALKQAEEFLTGDGK